MSIAAACIGEAAIADQKRSRGGKISPARVVVPRPDPILMPERR